MPTLNRYTKNSEQSGYYIRANVGGTAPITLQVSALAYRVFQLLEYAPGDSIPTKLVWSMYDLGLVYTLNSFSPTQDQNSTEDISAFIEELDSDNSLSDGDQNYIINQLKQYDGPDTEEVEKLIERLQNTTTRRAEVQQIGEAIPLAVKWAENPERLEILQNSIDKYTEFVTASIKTFARHPYLSAPPITVNKDGSIEYELSHENYSEIVYIQDRRIWALSHSYRVIVEHTNGGREIAEISDSGYIAEYTNNAGRRGLRMKVEAMLEWVLPASRITESVEYTGSLAQDPHLPFHNAESNVTTGDPEIDDENLIVGTIDRKSNSGNLVVEIGDDHILVDKGEVGETYLIEPVSNNKGRVVSRAENKIED